MIGNEHPPAPVTLPVGSGSRARDLRKHDPAAQTLKENPGMKNDIHPEYAETTVTCSCGATFTTRSTAKGGSISTDVCSQCHPFYTGKQKILDTGGRVARFQARYGKKAEKTPAAEADKADADK
jgi:large subunit ribosomal protein L31